MTDQTILNAAAEIVRPTFRTPDDPLPHPDEAALVHRLAEFLDTVLAANVETLEKAYRKGWADCASVAKREMDAVADELAEDFAITQSGVLRRRAGAEGRSDA